MKTRRKYSREFKIEAVRMANEPGVTPKQMREDGELQAFPGQGKPRDEEMAALKRELNRVRKKRDFFKRSGVLRERTRVKYRMIERCRDAFPVRTMCRHLGVSPSGFYASRDRPLSVRAKDNERLTERIKTHHAESDGVMGAPRIWRELRYEGETASLNRVARLMRKADIQGIPQRRRWRAKRPEKRPIDVCNHLDRDFSAQYPNTRWSTDITYVRTAENWLNLCVVLDLRSGLVVGWSMSRRQDRQLVIQAVLMALWQRKESMPVILHSDRGCQFTSDEYQRFLNGHNLVCTMSAVGSAADNAAVEGFFGLLKRERVNRRQYHTRAEARADIFDYIERSHNHMKQRELDGQN